VSDLLLETILKRKNIALLHKILIIFHQANPAGITSNFIENLIKIFGKQRRILISQITQAYNIFKDICKRFSLNTACVSNASAVHSIIERSLKA
jgi:hypothetical protein